MRYAFMLPLGCLILLIGSIALNDGYPASLNCEPEIYFFSSRSGNGDIYAINPITKKLRIVVASDSAEGAPRIDRFRNRLIYRVQTPEGEFLHSKSLENGKTTRLFKNPAGDEVPDWAPDAQKIVYTEQTPANKFNLIVRDLRTGEKTILVENALSDFYPSWSKDGSKVLFEISDSTTSSGLGVINADGTGFRKLTSDGRFYGHPNWSPDGENILFYIYQGGQADIYSMDLQDNSVTQLTNTPTNELVVRYSPDGQNIVFGGLQNDDWELFTMSATGNNIKPLVQHPGFDGDATWVDCIPGSDH